MGYERSEGTNFVGAWIPEKLKKAMDDYLSADTHKTISEFLRNAIREKLNRDAPWIIQDLLKEAHSNGISKE